MTAAAVALGVIMGIFTAFASPTTASVLPVSTSPTSAVTPSSTILVNAVTASVSSPLLSYTTSSICLPLMPPASFTFLKYSSASLRTPSPYTAYSPECGPSRPTFMVSPLPELLEALLLPPAEQPANITAAITTAITIAKTRFILLSSVFCANLKFLKNKSGSPFLIGRTALFLSVFLCAMHGKPSRP